MEKSLSESVPKELKMQITATIQTSPPSSHRLNRSQIMALSTLRSRRTPAVRATPSARMASSFFNAGILASPSSQARPD
ncbi:VP2 [Green River chinook virus]|uniref:VP2 n=1 Tax=Green River chinook virus TaxID=1382300 RepID=W6EW59_9REOV|nr:VP2 [Green River chinook virus]AHJ14802.1 VP2 [Green River chinook virus]